MSGNKFETDRHLKDLFALGTTYSEPMEIFPGVKVTFRLVNTEENIEIAEATAQYVGMESRALVSQVHLLARCIVDVNGMHLIMPAAEADAFSKTIGRDVNRVEQAVHILVTQFPRFVIDAFNAAYLEFHQGILAKVDEIKKKLKPPTL